MRSFRGVGLGVAGALLLAVSTGHAQAQSPYPSQQIKIICPFPAGGGTDLTARLLGGSPPASTLGQTVVVENRTGASGMVGHGRGGESAPRRLYPARRLGRGRVEPAPLPEDGVRLGQGPPAHHAARQGAERAGGEHGRARRKRSAELIAWAKQNPDNLTFSSSGVGNPQQLTGELFNKLAGREVPARPLQGRRAADSRRRGQAHHDDFRQHRRGAAFHRGQPGAADRGHFHDARVRAAGRARRSPSIHRSRASSW